MCGRDMFRRRGRTCTLSSLALHPDTSSPLLPPASLHQPGQNKSAGCSFFSHSFLSSSPPTACSTAHVAATKCPTWRSRHAPACVTKLSANHVCCCIVCSANCASKTTCKLNKLHARKTETRPAQPSASHRSRSPCELAASLHGSFPPTVLLPPNEASGFQLQKRPPCSPCHTSPAALLSPERKSGKHRAQAPHPSECKTHKTEQTMSEREH